MRTSIQLVLFLPSFLLLFGSEASAQIASRDQSFILEGSFSSTVQTVVSQPDGKVLVGGFFTSYNGSPAGRILRLNGDGSIDASFNMGTGFGTGIVYDIALQPDGKIIVVGTFTDFNGVSNLNRIVRLNTDGSLDPSFSIGSGLNGTGFAVLVQPDGKVLVCGNFTNYNGSLRSRLVRIGSTGAIDNTFTIGTGFNNDVYTIALQPDGKILAGGVFTQFNAGTQTRFVRLNADGSMDSSFGIGAGFGNAVNSIAVQDDGKIVVGGSFVSYDGNTVGRIVRLLSTGLMDPSFNAGTGFSNTLTKVVIDGNDNLLVGGSFTTFNDSEGRNRVARLLPDGSIDFNFNPGTGFSSTIEDIAIQSDGRILLSGSFTQYDGVSSNRLIRLLDHSITANGVNPTGPFCAGQSGVVNFSIEGGYNAGNVFTAQLSNATGNFLTPTDIGSITSTIGGSIPFVIPAGANSGSAYRIRVISTNPPVTGTDLGASSNLTISAIPNPTVNISVNPSATICEGTEAIFTAVAASGGSSPVYQWYTGDDPISGENLSTYTSSSLLDQEQIKVTMISNANCADGEAVVSNTVTMTVQPVEVPSVSIESNAGTQVCAGQSVTFTATVASAGAAPAYQWRRNGINVGLGANTYTTSTLSNGDVVTCEVFSNATCPQPASVTSDPITMTVNPNVTPVITIAADPGESVCSGNEVTFTAVTENEGATPFFVWNLNGVPVSNSSPSYTENALEDGDVIQCVLTSNATCVNPQDAESNTIQMTVNQSASINLSVTADPSGPICLGNEVIFTADVDDDLNDEEYAWTVNGLPVGQVSDVFTASDLVDGDIVQVIVTTDEACVEPDSETSAPIVMQVSTSDEPELTILSDIGTDICTGNEVTFTASVSGGGTSPSFAWTVNGSPAGTDSPTYVTSSLADGDVVACTFTATDPCDGDQQSVSDEMVISVNAAPVISGVITGLASVCAGDALTYTIAAVAGADAYTWTLPADWTGTSITSSISTVAAEAGGTISVTADNTCGSSTPVTIDVSSFPNFATVSGVVTVNGAPVFNGWVFAYKQELDTLGYIKADSTVILGGNYSFDELPLYGVPFILMAVATESAIDHTIAEGTMATYYAKNTANGQDTVYHQWDRPEFNCSLTATCGTAHIKNFTILLEGTADGDCSLNGTVFYYCPPPCKTASEDPIPGVDVVVEKVPPGNAFSWDQTESDGSFRFDNIPVDDNYRIYVNIPGIPMADTYSIEVTPSDTAITNLDFLVDTVENIIFIVEPNGIAHTAALETGLTVMPNPMNETMTVVLKRGMSDAVAYRIMNLSGQAVRSRQLDSARRFTVERDGLSTGIYFLETQTANGDRTTVKIAIQ